MTGMIAVSLEPLVQRRAGGKDAENQQQDENKRRYDRFCSPA
jgi:hypothetical protein